MVAKSCSRSQGQPLPGVRNAAMISSRREISREWVMMRHGLCERGVFKPCMPQYPPRSQHNERGDRWISTYRHGQSARTFAGVPMIQSARSRAGRKFLRPQFDWRAMRRAVGGMVPGIAVAMLGFEAGYALRRDQPLKRGEPMPVIGFAGVGIAARLRAFDFLCKRCGPLVPREDAAF